MRHLNLRTYLIILFVSMAVPSFAQVDSARIAISTDAAQAKIKEPFFTRQWVQGVYIGAPLVVAGALEAGIARHHASHFADHEPDGKRQAETYLQYSPAALMLALKACGVKSRSSWGKMMTAAAATTLLQFCTTQGLKHVISEERPDGTDNHSFPSGHTATAFMTATMLSKEYGHLSPWVSVGAYGVATATGALRIIHDRHWTGDVLVGAGIGIICTELGYWLSDLIFKKEKKSYKHCLKLH